MKISYLLTQDIESPSGLGRFWPMANEMNKLGHNVSIYALHPNYDELSDKKFFKDGVLVEYVAPMHILKKDNTKSYYRANKLIAIAGRATWKLISASLNSHSDIVHICKPHPMNSVAGIMNSYLRRKIILLDCDDYEEGIGHFKSNWQKNLTIFFERKTPHFARHITTNTHFMKSRLIDWGLPPGKITYIPNGINRERFSIKDRRRVNILKQELHLENKPVVAYIGTVGLTSHAIDLLINAFKIVCQTRPDCVLMIVGGGEDFQQMQDYGQSLGLTNNIRWIGKVSPELVPLYYQLANVSIDPVKQDLAAQGRAPLKLFESWACGIPFISGDVGDRKFLLGNPPAGLLTPAGNTLALAQAILHVLSNIDLADTLRVRGLQKIEKFYWDRISTKLNEVYLSLYSLRSN